MLRTIQVTEKNVFPLPAKLVPLPAGVNTVIIPDYKTLASYPAEILSITIQNVGNNDCYIAFNQTVDPANAYHKWLQSGQELAVPGVVAVNGYSTNGTTIATSIWHRAGL